MLILLAGCATQQLVQFPDPKAAAPDPQKARIYVMRDPEIGSIAGQRGYLSWERKPGEVSLSVPGEAYLGLIVEEGSVTYVVVHDKGRRVLAGSMPPHRPE